MRDLISGIDHLRLQVRDLSQQQAEYAALLGRPADWSGRIAGRPAARFTVGTLFLWLIEYRGAPQGLVRLAFRVTDLARMKRRLQRLGMASSDVSDDDSGPPITEGLQLDPGHSRALPLAMVAGSGPPAAGAAEPGRIYGLDHLVIRSGDAQGSMALFGARLGLDLRMDIARPEWGARLLFFRCGDMVLELLEPLGAAPGNDTRDRDSDSFYGLSWRVMDADAAHARLVTAGVDVSAVREGRRPGTRVLSVNSHQAGVPTLLIEPPRR